MENKNTVINYNAAPLSRRVSSLLKAVLFPAFLSAGIAAVLLFVNLRIFYSNGYYIYFIAAIIAVCAFAAVFREVTARVAAALRDSRRKYSYVEVSEREALISLYGGVRRGLSEKKRGAGAVVKTLYVVFLKDLKSVEVNSESGEVILKTEHAGPRNPREGEMCRVYCDEADLLHYSFTSGYIEFDSDWFNYGYYKTSDTVTIPACFGSASDLAELILAARERYGRQPAAGIGKTVRESDKRRQILEKLKSLNNL